MRGGGAAERREKRETGVLRGNQGRSAGATTQEERAVPAGGAGNVQRARGGGNRAEKGEITDFWPDAPRAWRRRRSEACHFLDDHHQTRAAESLM